MIRFAFLIFVASVACRDSTEPASPEDRAVAEFRGSYPETIAPSGVVRTFDVIAAPTKLPLVDGKELEVWAYNRQVPGPTLRVKLGETLRVKFTNQLPQETTIHWHGVRLPNAMDGVPFITQKPVQPGETFVYEFTPEGCRHVLVSPARARQRAGRTRSLRRTDRRGSTAAAVFA